MGKISKLPDLIPKSTVLHNRFVVFGRLGQGGFGQVFRGRDMHQRNRVVAVKVEPPYRNTKDQDPRRMIVEQKVLIALRGKRHIPMIYASGKTDKGCPYIVMQLLGQTLDDLRARQRDFHFSLSTTVRISQQVICGLEYLHVAGWLHRDIKPCNTCVGHREPRTIYLIDFGMAREYVKNGVLRRPRKKGHFRGTYRYASLRMHAKQECGPSDDLQSWLYSMIEIHANELPWTPIDEMDRVYASKRSIPLVELCRNMPPQFYELCTYVSTLEWDQLPDYAHIHEILRSCLSSAAEYTRKFDWELDEEPTDAFSTSRSMKHIPAKS